MPLLSADTGIIITPPFAKFETERMFLSMEEYDAKILFFLTYFDRLATAAFNPLPGGRLIVCSTELEQILVHRRLLKTVFPPRIEQRGSWGASLPAGLAEWAFHDLNQEPQHGQYWALAPADGLDPEFHGEEIDVLVMTLRKLLPAPRPGTPLEDVLTFKERYREQLGAFRLGVNELALMFRGGMGSPDAAALVESKLSKIVSSVQAPFNAWHGGLVHPDLSVSFALPRVAVSAAAEWIAQQIGAPTGTGMLVASSVTFNLGKSKLGKDANSYPSDFKYLVSGIREALLESSPTETPPIFNIHDLDFSDNKVPLRYPPYLLAPAADLSGEFKQNFS